MIAFNYFLIVKCILISFFTFSTSVKTYQVRRVNESTYLVTSFPEFDYDDFKKSFEEKTTTNKVLSLNDDKRSPYSLSFFDSTSSTVTVGDKREKAKNNIPASVINKAREDYFRTYFATMKKSNLSLLPYKTHPYMNLAESLLDPNNSSLNLNHNLVIARKLATVLIDEGQNSHSAKFRGVRKKRRIVMRRNRTKHVQL